MSVKGFSHVTFAISLYLEALHPEYRTLAPLHMASAKMTCVSVSFTRRRTISPSFGCQSSSLAFILIREFSSLYRAVLETYCLRYIRCNYSDTMLYSPLGFPFRIRCEMTGCFFHLPFFDIFLPAACSRRHLIYALMGARKAPPYCSR